MESASAVVVAFEAAFSDVFFACPAFDNNPLSPVNVAIATPAKIRRTMMYRKLLMVSQ